MKYKILKEVYHGTPYEVYRGKREEDGLSVIIKKIASENTRKEDLFRLQNEFEVLTKKSLSSSIQALDFINGNTLILEDMGVSH